METANERIDNVESDLRVGLRRPVLGHGLGTSREANANFGDRDQISHNLYVEVLQELGMVGLAIFLFFLKSIVTTCAELRRAYVDADHASFQARLADALQVWLWMSLIFSFASYGLSNYDWYMLAGLAVALRRMAVAPSAKQPSTALSPQFARPQR